MGKFLKVLTILIVIVSCTFFVQEVKALDCTIGNCYCDDSESSCVLKAKPDQTHKNEVDKIKCGCTEDDENGEWKACSKSGIVKTFQIIGYALYILKIAVPLLLLLIGSMDLGKAAIAGDDKAISNAVQVIVKRAIAGVVIFFIPLIISFVIGLVDSADNIKEFDCLSTCIGDPSNCKIPKDQTSTIFDGE